MDVHILFPSAPTRTAAPLGRAETDDLLERLFAAPSVDPGQVPMHGRTRLESGERRLALAILADALRCVLNHHDSRSNEQRQAAREALEWMHSDDDAPPFTFVRLCQLFDLEPDWIREAVRRRLLASRSGQAHAARTRHAA